MAITDSIKQILSVKIKPRHDSYSDQFSRIFMVKIMMISALLVGLSWYTDKINCIIPSALGVDGNFVAQACWINGLYVYKDIRYHVNDIGYYGLPRDINNDGMFENGDICATTDSSHRVNEKCRPMEKTFYLQYQYMTFIMAALAVLYYAPYAFFRLINQDIVSLKGSINDNDAEGIVKNYFNYKINSEFRMRMRIIGNIMIKLLYIVGNVAAFLIVDGVLNGDYKTYGITWTTWSKLPNSMAYDYMGQRLSAKPGNILLPSFAFCEVHEAAQDIKNVITNKHKFVCELSQHILYQYVFIICWFTMVISIAVAVLGFIMQIAEHIMTMACFMKGGAPARKMYQVLTLRECEYLEYIRRKNMPLYGAVIQKLKEERYDGLANDQKPMYDGGNSYEMN
ncbi:uncharacterized protein [Clytia hemisphaerica]|uniref:Innexin n=1 Tax=Clytia hemisphaerica TaxID=252671 RepID=A0A7M5VB13_9CNID|eukprot:TCONS_00024465-protein